MKFENERRYLKSYKLEARKWS